MYLGASYEYCKLVSMGKNKSVIVVGGGIVGLSTAYFLQKAGHEVTVLDRSASFGAYGPLFTEIRSALYNLPKKPLCYNRIYGLGGRDLLMSDIKALFEESTSYLDKGSVEKDFDFICVRGGA